jgi:acyl carrier protein
VTIRDRLLEHIESWDLEIDGPLRDDTALITSGIFDSQALFKLMLWIEEQIGRPIDPASLDFVDEWNTIDNVVRFIERIRERG